MATENLAPLLNSDGSAIISGKFIIILLESLTDEDVATTMQIATDIVKEAGGMNTITTTYNMGTFRGFAATLDNETLTKIRSLPTVKYAECDSTVSVAGASTT